MRYKTEIVYYWSASIIMASLLTGSCLASEDTVDESFSAAAMVWDSDGMLASVFGLKEGDKFPDGAELHLWQGGQLSEPLIVPYGARSKTIQLNRGREVVFLKRPFNPDIENDQPPVAAMATIPNYESRALLLLVPTDILNNDYRVIAFDESLSAFPVNSLRLVNFTSVDLAIQIDGINYDLNSSSEKIVSLGIENGRSARLLVARPREEGSRPDYISRRISMFDGIRATCFFIDSEDHHGTLVARIISEDTRYLPKSFNKSTETDNPTRYNQQ